MNHTKFYKYLKNSDLKPNTIKKYISVYNTLEDLFKNDSEFLINPEQTIKTLLKEYTNNKTLVAKFNIILLLLKLYYETNENYESIKAKYIVEYTRIKDTIKEVQEKQEPTEKQLERQISTEQNKQIIEILKKAVRPIKTIEDLIPLRNLIIYLYQDKQQGRGDYITSHFIYEMPDNTLYNYFYLDKVAKVAYYIQNHHKTDRKLAQQKFILDNTLYRLLTRLFNAYKKLKFKNQYAFYQDNGNIQMNTDNLSKLYKKIGDYTIHAPLSIQVMRTQKSSNDIETLTPLMEKARKQGHNLNTTTKHYLKKGLKKL